MVLTHQKANRGYSTLKLRSKIQKHSVRFSSTEYIFDNHHSTGETMISKIEEYACPKTGLKLTLKGCFSSRFPKREVVDVVKNDFLHTAQKAIEESAEIPNLTHNQLMVELGTRAHAIQGRLLAQFGPESNCNLLSTLGVVTECTSLYGIGKSS